MKVFSLLIAVEAYLTILNAGAVAAPTIQPYERVVLQIEAQHSRASLEQKLVDFPSARIQGVYAGFVSLKDPVFGKNYAAPVICGQINAKNPMGGYRGWQAFVVVRENGPVAKPTVYTEDDMGGGFVVMAYCYPDAAETSRFDRNAVYTDLVNGKKKVVN
jgi:hypothetical protein